ncbi:MAG: hypothetical protein J4F36_13185 [Nitrosopumilaceae archaeon]|nr:hypothetical protein [Nitrosopumilaceae archaeon]
MKDEETRILEFIFLNGYSTWKELCKLRISSWKLYGIVKKLQKKKFVSLLRKKKTKGKLSVMSDLLIITFDGFEYMDTKITKKYCNSTLSYSHYTDMLKSKLSST